MCFFRIDLSLVRMMAARRKAPPKVKPERLKQLLKRRQEKRGERLQEATKVAEALSVEEKEITYLLPYLLTLLLTFGGLIGGRARDAPSRLQLESLSERCAHGLGSAEGRAGGWPHRERCS